MAHYSIISSARATGGRIKVMPSVSDVTADARQLAVPWLRSIRPRI